MLYNGFVYLAKSDTGHYKIGRSKYPLKRVKHFDTIMPVTVAIIHYFPCDDPVVAEEFLHNLYSRYKFKGEWFDFPTESPVESMLDILAFINGEPIIRMNHPNGFINVTEFKSKLINSRGIEA